MAFLSGIGSGELAVVMIIVLLIFGPKQLPEMARSMAKALRGIRRATDEIKEEIGIDKIMEGGKIDKSDFDLSKPYEPKHLPPPLPPPHLTDGEGETPEEDAPEAESADQPESETDDGPYPDGLDDEAQRQAAEQVYQEAIAAADDTGTPSASEGPAPDPDDTGTPSASEGPDDPDRRDS